MKENIAQMAARGAKLWPSKVAIEACGRTLTYQELDEQSDVLAQGLARLGHAFGDRLVISLNNCIEYILVSFLCTVQVWSWLVLTYCLALRGLWQTWCYHRRPEPCKLSWTDNRCRSACIGQIHHFRDRH